MTAPHYLGSDWMLYTQGMALVGKPPPHIQTVARGDNLTEWEQVARATLRAQQGDFSEVPRLLEVALTTHEDRLQWAAITLFALSAPSALVVQLARAFSHASFDMRVAAYRATTLACNLELASLLARRRSQLGRRERESVEYHISGVLDADPNDPKLMGGELDDHGFVAQVDAAVAGLRARHGRAAIYEGQPLSVPRLAARVRALCALEDFEIRGGIMDDVLCLIEGMTGTAYAGCFDADCVPRLPEVARVLEELERSAQARVLTPGRRYFCGHALE
ncbi:MAG: hypothetical protein RL701_4996 [Pseudomonadota bacterium]